MPTEAAASAACRVVQRLQLDDLLALMRGDLLALRWPGFYPEGACRTVAERLLAHPARGFYENGPHIGRVGMAYFEAGTDEARERYYQQAIGSIALLRETCRPYANPIDLLRVTLDEAWPGGAALERLDGRAMFVGLVRIFDEGSGARAHQDVLEWDAPATCAAAQTLITQLSANIYIQPCLEGGELELWDFGVTREEYDALKIPGAVALDRERLRPSALELIPQAGELILLNSTKLHAVRPIKSGRRMTASTFIGVRAKREPLTLWS